ncbi:MAG: hypothetical protein AAGD07_03585 [Planctomycetota bacterium]
MRKQVRPDEPEVLTENADEWNARWKATREKNPSAKFVWYKWKRKSSREWLLPALRELNQEHCCFCDAAPLPGVSAEPIEHFRPKSDSRFYDLAYTWPNLFYACEACQSSKLNRWDDRLIAPDETDYTFERYFAFDFSTGAISPNPHASIDEKDRARETIHLFGLDSEIRRRRRRETLRKWQNSNLRDIDDFPYRDFLTS